MHNLFRFRQYEQRRSESKSFTASSLNKPPGLQHKPLAFFKAMKESFKKMKIAGEKHFVNFHEPI